MPHFGSNAKSKTLILPSHHSGYAMTIALDIIGNKSNKYPHTWHMTERPEGDRKGAGVRGGAGKLHAIEIEWFKRSFQWLQFNKP